MTPVDTSERLRSLIQRMGLTVTEAAVYANVKRTTLHSYMQGTVTLDPLNRRHRQAIAELCSAVGASEAEVWGEPLPPLPLLPQQAKVPVGSARPGLHLLEILLDTLENPRAPADQKAAARATIIEWVRSAMP